MFDILFRNAKVIDGTGNPWFYGDVGVEGGTVAAVLPPGSTALGRSLGQLAPILRNLQCWVAPRQFALSHAGKAFTPFGTLVHEASHEAVQGVVDQVMLAAGRLHPGT